MALTGCGPCLKSRCCGSIVGRRVCLASRCPSPIPICFRITDDAEVGGFIRFVLGAILDKLTTTIVMSSLMKKLVDRPGDREFFVGMIVIAANAGGAWSPIGDVTTTMLWIGGQIPSDNWFCGLFPAWGWRRFTSSGILSDQRVGVDLQCLVALRRRRCTR